jgi:general secretion pathway protein H
VYRTAGGFTLLELLLVLTLMAMMVALVPPLLSRALPGVSARSLVNDVVLMVRESRSRAIVSNRKQQIYFDRQRRALLSEAGRNSLDIPDGLRLEFDKGDGLDKVVLFSAYPDGTVSGGQIVIWSERHRFLLRVNWISGVLEVEERSGEIPN